MGRNEIRLRRQLLSSGRIARHRNYPELMRQHDKELRLKRVLRVFTYFLIILFFLIVLLIVIRWENKKKSAPDQPRNTPASVTFTDTLDYWGKSKLYEPQEKSV